MPITLDLFAGAGGITEGFRQAGFKCVFANDFNKDACATFALNHPNTPVACGPIESLDPHQVRKSIGLRKGELDVLVGGPPCQGFSIYAHGRFTEDPRNAMFTHYLRFVDEFAPKAVMFENVPGMLSLAQGAVFDEIVAQFESRGYRMRPRILCSAHYGVPQMRWRMILLGSKQHEAPAHPIPTHYFNARANFTGGKTLATRLLPMDQYHLLPAVTLRDAVADLPAVKAGEGEEVASYGRKIAKSAFAKEMRLGAAHLFNHTANQLRGINLERLAHIPPGGAWTDIPFDLLPAGMKKARRSDHTKRYGRPTWDSVSCTMLTKCDPHWGAVFHPEQQRTFTVREAARIQSFPDRYQFLGSRISQYEQVGNAVPVLMARAIATTIEQWLLTKPKKTLERTTD